MVNIGKYGSPTGVHISHYYRGKGPLLSKQKSQIGNNQQDSGYSNHGINDNDLIHHL